MGKRSHDINFQQGKRDGVANAYCSNIMPRNFASVQPFYRVLYSFRSFHLFVCLEGLAETSFKVYVKKGAGFEKMS